MRKAVLREMKKLSKIMAAHTERHREALEKRWQETDLKEGEARQIVERIIGERQVKNDEKILSLYQGHAAVYVRGKAGAEVEFGSQLLLGERQSGVIVDWELVGGNPRADTKMLRRSLERMKDGKFVEMQKRRSQTEARISIFKNGFPGSPLLSKGHANQEREVAWNVLAHNLWVMARLDSKQNKRRKRDVRITVSESTKDLSREARMGPPERVAGPNEYAGNRTCYSVIGLGAKMSPNGTGSMCRSSSVAISAVKICTIIADAAGLNLPGGQAELPPARSGSIGTAALIEPIEDGLEQLPWPVLIGVCEHGPLRRGLDSQVAKLAFASGQAAGDLPQRLHQLAKQHVNELVQHVNPRACLSALPPLTALSNSCLGKDCNACAKILHSRIHGGGVLKTEVGLWRDATSTYRRRRLTPQMPIWTRFGQD